MPRQLILPKNQLAIFLAVLSGLFYGISFPLFNCGASAWVALIPLLLISHDSFRAHFTSGLLSGFLANVFIFWWLVPTFIVAHQPWGITFISLVALSSLMALYFGFFKAFDGLIPESCWKPFSLAAAWVVLEWVRSWILTGLPWALLGHTQYKFIAFIQLASVTGVEGISFFIVLLQAWAVGLWKRKYSFRKLDAVVPVLFIFVLVWGAQRIKSETHLPAEKNLRVALLQGDIDQYQKWDAQYEAGIRERYRALALQAKKQNPDLMIWPESSVPGWLLNDPFYTSWVVALSTEMNIPQLVGAVSSNSKGDFNGAFLYSAEGQLLGQYAKQHLVPFGEYVPLKQILSNVTPYLGQLGKFESGNGPGIFTINQIQLAPTICYEMIFPDLVRRSALAGADILVNITNDGWYLKTGAPMQHFVTNIFRALETGKPVVRSANTGISGVIDPWGRILQHTELMEPTISVVDVAFSPKKSPTLYMLGGNWFCWLCLLLVVAMLVTCPANSKKKLKN